MVECLMMVTAQKTMLSSLQCIAADGGFMLTLELVVMYSVPHVRLLQSQGRPCHQSRDASWRGGLERRLVSDIAKSSLLAE